MAAFLNSLWGGLNTAKTAVVGPSYSYVDKVPRAERGATDANGRPVANLGVGEDGNFGQLGTNMNAGMTYVKMMTRADRPLGNSYFINTGGTCINSKGQLVDRYNYINNFPESRGLQASLLGQGLIGGVASDVTSMDPTYLLRGLTADATPACDLYKCSVTDRINGETQYLTPGMTPDFNKGGCQKIDLGDPAGAESELRAKIQRIREQIAEIQQQLAKNSRNKTLKTALLNLQDELATANDELGAMVQRRGSRREPFENYGSPALGGVFLAGVLLAALVFRKRR